MYVKGMSVANYIRVLGKSLTPPSLKVLQRAADPGVIECEERVGDEWEGSTVKHKTGEPIALVERNVVAPGELGAEELQEFIDEVASADRLRRRRGFLNTCPA
jgi:hypothetical protein